MNNRISSKLYFWIAALVPLLLSIASAIVIFIDQQPSFCFTKECLETFVDLYSIPLQLLGLNLVLLGAVFTYYRIDLSFKQNERQIYNSFRDEFLHILESKSYKYQILDIPDIWLFNNLYPNSKLGVQTLLPEFEEFITYKDEVSQLGFTEAMNKLTKVLGTKEQYHAGSHFPIGNMFMWLREFMPIDADLNIGYTAGATFKGDYSDYIIKLGKDILFIVSSVNAFEGWRFFENKTIRSYRKNLDRLEKVPTETELISDFFKNANNANWTNTLMRQDYETFDTFQLADVIPPDLSNNQIARQFIFESYTDKKSNGFITEEGAVKRLKEKLRL